MGKLGKGRTAWGEREQSPVRKNHWLVGGFLAEVYLTQGVFEACNINVK